MNRIKVQHVDTLKKILIILNFAIVLYNASIFLLSSKFINENRYSRDFLNNVTYMPTSPESIFFKSILCFSLLVIFMHLRQPKDDGIKNDIFVLLEMVMMVFLISELKGSYNGVIYLVFADIVYDSKWIKNSSLMLLFCFGLLMISDYNILSKIIHIPSIESYISFYPTALKSGILFFRNILNSFNVVLFIAFFVVYFLVQQKEQQDVEAELEMISQVNDELKKYAMLTEKIGEDNERKRISREIHDTLGHALTGISAGIDACVALIDIDKDKTKQQLIVVSNVVRQGIKDVRRSLYKLRPGALEDRTLKDGLEKMIQEFESVSSIKIDLQYFWQEIDFENTKEDLVFRIIQESITNALRHGHAKHVVVQMNENDSEYLIRIVDDGVGCIDIKEGYGLKQMKERVEIINGKISFESQNGFCTFITIPKMRGREL